MKALDLETIRNEKEYRKNTQYGESEYTCIVCGKQGKKTEKQKFLQRK